MSILSAIKQQSGSINDLAKLPQTMIMQMAQRKEIVPEMVPVILAKKAEMIDRFAKAKAAEGGMPQQSIMEQVMAQNAQAENPQAMGQMPPPMPQQNQMAQRPPMQPQGAADVGIASNPVPPMQMAGGGIIAFARGDLVEDEDDEQDEYDDYVKAMQVQDYSIPITPAGEADTTKTATNAPTQSTKSSQMPAGGIRELISSKAEKYKLPADLMQRIVYSESGGKPDAANPLSSAKGLFQFTKATWKGMGGKEGEQLDPEKNAELGALFTRQNAEGLKKAFGKNPSYGEVYAANHFGLQGAKDLLGLDPKTPMEKAVPDIVLKQNPYLRGRTVGDVISQLNKKTGQGTVELAEGGAIHFKTGDAVKDPLYENMTDEQKADFDARMAGPRAVANFPGKVWDAVTSGAILPAQNITNSVLDMGKSIVNWGQQPVADQAENFRKASKFKKTDAVKPLEIKETPDEQIAREAGLDAGFSPKLPPAKPTSGSKKPIIKMDPNYAEIIDAEQSGNVATPAVSKETPKPTGETPKRNRYDDYFDRLMRQEEAIAKQEKNDQNNALLAAALKMYGGTSQYANANIGEGGLAGLQMLSEAQKNRAAQRAAIDKSYGVGLRYQELGENTKAQLAQNAAYNLNRIELELRNQNLTKEAKDALLAQRDRELATIELNRSDTLEEKRLSRSDINTRSARDDLAVMEKNWATRLQNEYIKNNPFFQSNPQQKAAYESDLAKLYSNPQYLNLQKQAYPSVNFDVPKPSYEGFSGKPIKG